MKVMDTIDFKGNLIKRIILSKEVPDLKPLISNYVAQLKEMKIHENEKDRD